MNLIELDLCCKKIDIGFFYKKKVTSTMDYAKKIDTNNHKMIVIIADEQTKGRGRINNNWESDKGNIFLTIKFIPQKKIKFYYQLGIFISLAIKKTINHHQIKNVQFKWPNDIYINNAKVGGILVENYSKKLIDYCLIGMGINFKSSPNINKYKTTYLKKFNNQLDLEKFLKDLIININFYIKKWEIDNLDNYLDFYKKSLMHLGKNVIININNSKLKGKFIDLTNDGYLLINIQNENKKVFTGSMELQ